MANEYAVGVRLFIDGERIGTAGRETHRAVNPADFTLYDDDGISMTMREVNFHRYSEATDGNGID
jgi:hypothetical protein